MDGSPKKSSMNRIKRQSLGSRNTADDLKVKITVLLTLRLFKYNISTKG
jgi:hypothetical protein